MSDKKGMSTVRSPLSTPAHTTVDLLRDTGWVVTLTNAQKQCVKLQKELLPKFGVSQEWLKTKSGKAIIALAAPALLAGLVWVLPLSPVLKRRMYSYLQQSIVLRLSGLLGDSYSGIAAAVLAVSGELTKTMLESNDVNQR